MYLLSFGIFFIFIQLLSHKFVLCQLELHDLYHHYKTSFAFTIKQLGYCENEPIKELKSEVRMAKFNRTMYTAFGNVYLPYGMNDDTKLTFNFFTFRETTGTWQNTIFNVAMENFCSDWQRLCPKTYKEFVRALTNQTEKDCPLEPGLHFVNHYRVTPIETALPPLSKSGDYKIHIGLIHKATNKRYGCFMFKMHASAIKKPAK